MRDGNHDAEPAPQREAYTAPALMTYGSLRALTLGTGFKVIEKGSNFD